MKVKPKQVLVNVPVILTFYDYHEIRHVEDYFNEVFSGKNKIKSEELQSCNEEYAAIFYFKKDKEYTQLVKEYAKNNKEACDYES